MAEGNGPASSAAFVSTGSLDSSDNDEYEDDSDFEYLNIPSYAMTEDPNKISKANEEGLIPFTSIHRTPVPYSSDDRVAFIPGVKVEVEIINVVKHDHHVLNPYLYSIQVKHGVYEWVVKRRYKDFRSLHDALILFRAKLHLPVPTRKHRLQRKTFKQRRESLPRFPRRPELMISEDEDLPERKRQLITYLQRILRFPPLRNHHETLKFFEVSHLSFVNGLGSKYREGLIRKRSGGRSFNSRFCSDCCGQCVQNMTAHYNNRWIVLKDTFLAYINPHLGTVSDVLLMDMKFDIESGFINTGVHHGIQLTTLNRELMLKGWTHRNAVEWKEAIEHVSETLAKDFTTPNRHDSYAPFRPKGHAQWFVDAASYMSSVADAMEGAKEEIFITDWWLSPEIYMKRPMTEGDKWRLDVILKRKAEEGVKIFVMLFKEVELALGINSYYTKQALLKLNHMNIRVLRHPDGLLLWSHHEKMVVIDQRIAYLGGIDLCYGRYDTPEHRLTDLGSIMTSVDLNDPDPHTLTPVPETEQLVAGKFPPPEPTTPSYNRTISSHSWPETERDKEKIGFIDPTGAHRGIDVTDDMTVKKSLATISEASLSIESETTGISSPESIRAYDDQPKTSSQSPSSLSPVPNAVTNHKITSIPEIAVGVDVDDGPVTSQITADNMNRNPEDPATNQGKSSAPRSKSDNNNASVKLKQLRRQVSELSADTEVTDLSNVHLNIEPDYNAEVDSGHVNPAVELTPVRTKPKPPPLAAVATSAAGAQASDRNHNLAGAEKPKTMSSRWRKVKAVTMMTRLIPEGIQSTPDQPAEVAGRIPPGKRTKLQRQARVGDGTGGASANTLGVMEVGTKPTTPLPKSKFSQKAQDIKGRFRKTQSKSVDVSEDTEFDFSFYKNLERTDHPDGVLEELGLMGSTKIWIGKDYVNFITKDFRDLDQPFSDFIDRTRNPRMPWHDIGAVVYGKAARDVARHFIQRWNFSKVEKRKTNHGYPLLLPKAYTKVSVPRGALASSIPCNVQILRSASKWSAGISETDESIQTAYLSAIKNAKHYIYIENQFFISIMDDNTVTNGISAALYERILRAFREGTTFRVIVVMPLLPAFEGELGTPSGGAIQAVQYWNCASICRGGKSLIERLREHIPDYREYISFYGLRGHDELSGNLVTELVYVHSKMMIVDDRTVIIGSANINDRSLLGTRDSELAVITEDIHMRQSRMNGEPYEAGWFASGLRQALFREHLGVSQVNPELDIIDPIIPSFYKGEWMKQAAINTRVYDEVFHCIPTDNVESFDKIKLYTAQGGLAKTDPALGKQKLKDVRGHLVCLPHNFLIKDNLQPTVLTKEGLAPVATWT